MIYVIFGNWCSEQMKLLNADAGPWQPSLRHSRRKYEVKTVTNMAQWLWLFESQLAQYQLVSSWRCTTISAVPWKKIKFQSRLCDLLGPSQRIIERPNSSGTNRSPPWTSQMLWENWQWCQLWNGYLLCVLGPSCTASLHHPLVQGDSSMFDRIHVVYTCICTCALCVCV